MPYERRDQETEGDHFFHNFWLSRRELISTRRVARDVQMLHGRLLLIAFEISTISHSFVTDIFLLLQQQQLKNYVAKIRIFKRIL